MTIGCYKVSILLFANAWRALLTIKCPAPWDSSCVKYPGFTRGGGGGGGKGECSWLEMTCTLLLGKLGRIQDLVREGSDKRPPT